MSRTRLTWWERLMVDAEMTFYPYGKWTGIAVRYLAIPGAALFMFYANYAELKSHYPANRRLGVYDDSQDTKSFAVHNFTETPVRVDRIQVRMDPKTVQETYWVKHFGRHYLPLTLAWETYGDPRCTVAVARDHERYLLNPGDSLPLLAAENAECAESAKFFFNHVEKMRFTYWEWPEVMGKEVVRPKGLWDSKKSYFEKVDHMKAVKSADEKAELEARTILREFSTGQKVPTAAVQEPIHKFKFRTYVPE